MSYISVDDKIEFLQQCRSDPVFFVENLLYSESAEPYILEPHQKQFLRCPESYRMLFWARRLSKSTVLRFDILHKAFFVPNLRSLIVLPSWSQANDTGGEVQDLIRRSPLIGEMFIKTNISTMLLENGSRIYTASAGNEGVGQLGRGARYLAFDEAQQIQDKVYGYILPIMRGTPGKKWQSFAGTPLGKMGMFWEVYNDAKLIVDKNKVQKVECDDPISGEKFVVFQRQTAYLDGEGNIVESGTGRLDLVELMTDRKRMSEVDFLREYCLNWMDTIGEVFPRELVDACELNGKNDTVKMYSTEECVAGVDFGKQRHNSVVTVGESKAGGKIRIIFYHSFPLGTDYKDVANYCCKTLPKKFPNLRRMVVDKTGVGDAVIEDFIEDSKGSGIKIEGFNFAGQDKKRGLVEAGVMEMEQGKVKFVHNINLKNEMLTYKRIVNADTGRITYDKPSGGSDDFVDSFLLCLGANRGVVSPIGDFNVLSVGTKIMDRFGSALFGRDTRYRGNTQYRGRI